MRCFRSSVSCGREKLLLVQTIRHDEITNFFTLQYYIDSLDNDAIIADITKSAIMQFQFDLIQGPVINNR